MPESPATTLLEDAIDIPAWLEADSATPLAERMQRDREIGRSLGADDSVLRVRGWWQRIGGHDAPRAGRRLQHARRLIHLALVLVGLVAGSALAFAAFRYDGSYPVNVFHLLALLVAPQLVLLLLNLVLVPGRVPGLGFIQDALSALNPGALAGAVYRQLTGRPESELFAFASAGGSARRRFAKWQMLTWSQASAVAFNLGVIATAAGLVAFTDLAFGWSTTLDVDSALATRLFDTIAAPWAALFPGAVPGPELVEQSQFFRLEGSAGLADSRVLTGWWSFSVLAVVTYGLMPRIVFLLVSGWRLRAATRALLLGDPRVAALIDRMAAPDLATQGTALDERSPPPPPAAGRAARAGPASPASAVIWNQSMAARSVPDLVLSRLGFVANSVIEAGGGSLADERKSLARLADAREPVVVLTPAWEAPQLEFVDFLGDVRRVIGATRPIVVLPVAEDEQTVTPIERENWSRAVGRARDPNAFVAEAGS